MADIELVIKIPEELYYLVHCPVCHNNDGLPHPECYDCEPYNEI